MWENLSTREKRLIIVFISITAIFALYRFVWTSQLPRWQDITSKLQTERVALAKDKARAGRLPKLEQEFAALADEAAKVRQKFEVTLNDGNPYVEMGFRSEDKVTLTKVLPRPPESKGQYQVLPVQMELKGSYVGQLQFIKALENLPTMSEITQISMAAADKGPYPELQSGITLLLYSINDAVPGKLRGKWELGRFDIFSPTLQSIIDQEFEPLTGEQKPGNSGAVISSDYPKKGRTPVYSFPVK
ncbi:type 4a pilus biogenesis protein PilO [Metallumcola ferriviriculae]|uniref:Type 4a pilus biogenesis protein PilO n=1 Tax=Metallumcola ferriviriculae TaxID=3039180 RepID=A0AAU0US72_9FIRM|nr:type 4a pilus biogenesis protein PilO [Desulfitibacteraceae bacterium MK1]